MRPSGTAGAALLVLLAAHFPASPALEEKKGKGETHRPRAASRRAPTRSPPSSRSRHRLGVPRRPPLLSCFLEDQLRLWPGPWEELDVSFLGWASVRRRRTGGSVRGAAGLRAGCGNHRPEFGAPERSQLSVLTFLASCAGSAYGGAGGSGSSGGGGSGSRTCARACPPAGPGSARGARPRRLGKLGNDPSESSRSLLGPPGTGGFSSRPRRASSLDPGLGLEPLPGDPALPARGQAWVRRRTLQALFPGAVLQP